MALTPQIISSLTAAAIRIASPMQSRLTYNGREHVGCRGSANSARKYRPEGYTSEYRFTWIGNAAEFARVPQSRERVKCDGIALQVTATETDAAGGLLRIDLADPTAEA